MLARYQIQAAQSYCGTCDKYLTYHDSEQYDNDATAREELAKHRKAEHVILP